MANKSQATKVTLYVPCQHTARVMQMLDDLHIDRTHTYGYGWWQGIAEQVTVIHSIASGDSAYLRVKEAFTKAAHYLKEQGEQQVLITVDKIETVII